MKNAAKNLQYKQTAIFDYWSVTVGALVHEGYSTLSVCLLQVSWFFVMQESLVQVNKWYLRHKQLYYCMQGVAMAKFMNLVDKP